MKGVYLRTKAMKTYGKTTGKHGDIIAFRSEHSLTETAKRFGVTVATVCKIKNGRWK